MDEIQLAQMVADTPPETQDGMDLVEFLAKEEQAEKFENAAESYNLAQDLDSEKVREIGQTIWKGWEDDNESRTDWLDMHTFWLSLYMQADYAENSDSERSWGATESIPILTEACDQFQARAYKVFFPQEEFVTAIPVRKTAKNRKDLEERAKRVSEHMSYQLGPGDRNYKSDKDALFLGVALHGSFFTKTYYSDKHGRVKVDNVRPTDLVINYNVGAADIADVRRKTHMIYSTVGETQQLANAGYLSEAASPAQIEAETPYNIKVDETAGLSAPTNVALREDAQALLLEQHFYFDIDGSGEFRPYIGTVCAASKRLLRLTIGYEANPDGTPIDSYKQIQYFTHYKYKNNPDGFYGLGLGHTIGDLNSAANIMLRQTMDAATLANDGNMSGFISERLGIEGDEVSAVIGKLRKIPDTVGDIKNGIAMMEFPGPNAALIQLMEAIDQRAQRLGSTTEATTGTNEKTVQPTTYLAQIEQAMETFSAAQMRLANALGEELQKIYKINQKYLPLVSYYVVNDEPSTVTRMDYADDMLIMPVFDPKFATRAQKVARAEAELRATLENPINQQRPESIDEAFRRYLKALDVEDIDALIPPKKEPQNIDNQIAENMFFLLPPGSEMPLFDVFPEQNHIAHLQEIAVFKAQYGPMLMPEHLLALQLHEQKHAAYFYGLQNGVLQVALETRDPSLEDQSSNTVDVQEDPFAVPPMAAGFGGEELGGASFAGGSATGLEGI